ncbi:MAG TPA: UbiA family prenyltransferase [Thermoleophilaceae bacterium]
MTEGIRFVTQICRTALLGVTFAFVLLGAASADGRDPGSLVAILVTAVAYHVAVYAWNDVIDLPLDRTQPRRATSPLVRGVIGPRAVAAFATACGALALALAAAEGRDALLWMAGALGLLAVYNVAGKRLRASPLSDVVQGAGWAALVAYAASAAGSPSDDTLWTCVYTVLAIALINGVHGGVRDLPTDHAAGARTTAILLGARPLPGGGARVSRALAVYGFAVQAAMIGVLLAGLAAGGGAAVLARMGLTLTGGALAVALLAYGLAQAGGERSWVAGLLHLLLVLVLPVVLVADRLDTTLAVLFAVLFTGPWATVGPALRRGRAARAWVDA